MEEKQIRKYLRRCFLPVSWSLLAYTLILNTISPLSMVAEALAKVLQALSKGRPILPQDKLLEAVSGNAWGYLVAIAVGFTILLVPRMEDDNKGTVMDMLRSFRPKKRVIV